MASKKSSSKKRHRSDQTTGVQISRRAEDAIDGPSTKQRKRRDGTLAWLTDILVAGENGPQKARDALHNFLRNIHGYSPWNYKAFYPNEGPRVFRTAAKDDDKEIFNDFSPPVTWTPPYSLLKVKFLPGAPKDKRISHSGEEIIIPTFGKIDYVFKLKTASGLKDVLISEKGGPLQVGEVCRIQPSVPHYTWTYGEEAAEAWMVIRDLPANLAAVRITENRDGEVKPHHHDNSWFDENPELYPMLAWGIAEKISCFRAAAGMEIFHLANRLGIDRAQISRIESGGTNLGLLRLMTIAAELGFDASDGITQPLWAWNKKKLSEVGKEELQNSFSKQLACDDDWSPLVSARLVEIKKGDIYSREKLFAPEDSQKSTISSWVALKGSAFISTDQIKRYHLPEGGVFHARSPHSVIQIEADTSVQLVRFQCQVLQGDFPVKKPPAYLHDY